MMMWRYGDGYWGSGGAFGMALVMLLWWVLALGALVLVARWLFRQGRGFRREGVLGWLGEGAAPNEPLEIVKRRYAAGEITKEQYEEMKEALLR